MIFAKAAWSCEVSEKIEITYLGHEFVLTSLNCGGERFDIEVTQGNRVLYQVRNVPEKHLKQIIEMIKDNMDRIYFEYVVQLLFNGVNYIV